MDCWICGDDHGDTEGIDVHGMAEVFIDPDFHSRSETLRTLYQWAEDFAGYSDSEVSHLIACAEFSDDLFGNVDDPGDCPDDVWQSLYDWEANEMPSVLSEAGYTLVRESGFLGVWPESAIIREEV